METVKKKNNNKKKTVNQSRIKKSVVERSKHLAPHQLNYQLTSTERNLSSRYMRKVNPPRP